MNTAFPVSWVTLRTGTLEPVCGRCGRAEDAPRLPISIAAFVKWVGYVTELHAECKE
ncbi:MAG: hypothetical protein ACSLE9_07780 [Burkholderiaceae bacterium]